MAAHGDTEASGGILVEWSFNPTINCLIWL